MFDPVAATRLEAVVAVPVRNEADRITDCLDALNRQDGMGAKSIGVVLFLNNCTDATRQVVEAARPQLCFPLRILERDFADANAGWARREAMEAAARWLEEVGHTGVILTTDSDSRVPPDWVSRNLASINAGADAVAGRVVLDEAEAALLPDTLHARGRLEGAYEALLCELEAVIDPVPHDPWPRHWTTSGATLAVRLCAYRRVGGMPPLALGEDRAFVSSLLSSDARVRHDPAVTITTSGRLQGRAPGGAADTMRLRCEVPDSPCDPRLEALPRALFRYAWKHRLRKLHAKGALAKQRLWAPWLGISPEAACTIAALPALGSMIAAAEAASPWLDYHSLRPAALPANIKRAQRALHYIRRGKDFAASRRAQLPVPDALTAVPEQAPS